MKKLTDNQIKWVIRNFAHTSNKDIKAKLGITERGFQKLVVEYNLRRTKEQVTALKTGRKPKIILTPEYEQLMKNLYPITTTARISKMLNICPMTVIRIAKEMGLKKEKKVNTPIQPIGKAKILNAVTISQFGIKHQQNKQKLKDECERLYAELEEVSFLSKRSTEIINRINQIESCTL